LKSEVSGAALGSYLNGLSAHVFYLGTKIRTGRKRDAPFAVVITDFIAVFSHDAWLLRK
jgi:hypothetical protein